MVSNIFSRLRDQLEFNVKDIIFGMESGSRVIWVIVNNLNELQKPSIFEGFLLKYRLPSYILKQHLRNTGPTTKFAQTWSTDQQTRILWENLLKFKPDLSLISDYSCGLGKLVEFYCGESPLFLNDIDPLLINELKVRFNGYEVKYLNQDYHTLTNLNHPCILGNPPWIYNNENRYCPQTYLEVCERNVSEQGFVSLLLPTLFKPVTNLVELYQCDFDFHLPPKFRTSLRIFQKITKN